MQPVYLRMILSPQLGMSEIQGWQSIGYPGKTRWENTGFPGLDNTPRNGSTGQYWVIRYFPPGFIMKYFIVVLLLKLNIFQSHVHVVKGILNDMRLLTH